MALPQYIGTGIGFPLNEDGTASVIGGTEELGRCLLFLLGSRYGEGMNPSYGSRMNLLIGQTYNVVWRALARYYIREAASRWEKRIRIDSVTFEDTPRDSSTAVITIQYTVVANGQSESLVFPYYLEDGSIRPQ